VEMSLADLESICNEIQDLDSKIRFVGVISNNGKLLASGKRKVKLLVEEKNQEMMFMEVALRVRMRKEFDQQLGPVEFSLSRRKKILIMSFPFGDQVLYISAEKDLDLSKIPLKILEIIKVKSN
jgi:hypothetical protein